MLLKGTRLGAVSYESLMLALGVEILFFTTPAWVSTALWARGFSGQCLTEQIGPLQCQEHFFGAPEPVPQLACVNT